MIKKGYIAHLALAVGAHLSVRPWGNNRWVFKLRFKKVPWKRSGGGQVWVSLHFVKADDGLLGSPNLFCILLTVSIVELSRTRINHHKRCSAALATSLENTQPE